LQFFLCKGPFTPDAARCVRYVTLRSGAARSDVRRRALTCVVLHRFRRNMPHMRHVAAKTMHYAARLRTAPNPVWTQLNSAHPSYFHAV